MTATKQTELLPCPHCKRVHCSDDAVAIGRFRSDGVIGYTSTANPDHPLRGNRADAVQDTCDWFSSIRNKEQQS
jgi:hypothetical protein